MRALCSENTTEQRMQQSQSPTLNEASHVADHSKRLQVKPRLQPSMQSDSTDKILNESQTCQTQVTLSLGIPEFYFLLEHWKNKSTTYTLEMLVQPAPVKSCQSSCCNKLAMTICWPQTATLVHYHPGVKSAK